MKKSSHKKGGRGKAKKTENKEVPRIYSYFRETKDSPNKKSNKER